MALVRQCKRFRSPIGTGELPYPWRYLAVDLRFVRNFRRIGADFRMPAREAFILNRIKLGRGVGVTKTLKGHRSGTSAAEYVDGRHALELIGEFHRSASF